MAHDPQLDFESQADEPRGTRSAPLTVTQLTHLVRDALATALPHGVSVVGEISNFKHHGSGHLYFTLKDAACELACVMWRSDARRLQFEPQDGLEVIAFGEVTVYERSGRYQLYVRKLEPRGTGALELAFRQLHDRLQSAGLFDPQHKKDIPRFPAHIGIVTSPTGAAIRDILHTLERRFPCTRVTVAPAAVQGAEAGPQIARAIRQLNRAGDIDVLIVGRGGGSLEDLWAFNEEVVARAIFASRIPVISAVGHEVDVTISDLVADLRAPTPTAAAELAVPVREEVLADLAVLEARLHRGVAQCRTRRVEQLQGLARREPLRAPLRAVETLRQHIDHSATRLDRRCGELMHQRRRMLSDCAAIVALIEPGRVLASAGERVGVLHNRMEMVLMSHMQRAERRSTTLAAQLTALAPMTRVRHAQEYLVHVTRAATLAVDRHVTGARRAIEAHGRHLEAVSHQRTLQRGYSVTFDVLRGKMVLDPQQLQTGDIVRTVTAGGEFHSTVGEPGHQMELFEAT